MNFSAEEMKRIYKVISEIPLESWRYVRYQKYEYRYWFYFEADFSNNVFSLICDIQESVDRRIGRKTKILINNVEIGDIESNIIMTETGSKFLPTIPSELISPGNKIADALIKRFKLNTSEGLGRVQRFNERWEAEKKEKGAKKDFLDNLYRCENILDNKNDNSD